MLPFLLIFYVFFAHHSLAEDDLFEEFEQYLTEEKHLSCNIDERFPSLHRAAMTGSVKMVTEAIVEMKECGRNTINYQDSEGMSALHWAALRGHGGVVRSLIESGANSSSLDKGKNTALHLAAYGGDVKSVRWLVIFGGDLNGKNQNGSTALHIAVEREHFPVVEQLVNSCAINNATDYRGRTPLDLAVATNNLAITALLRASGADSVPKPEFYRWINKTSEDYVIPQCAVYAGKTYGGQKLYVGRIWQKDGYIPATIIPYHKKTATVIQGKYKEVSVDFQLLCGDHLAWKSIKANDDIPENAVLVATSRKGEKLYIGRADVSYSEKDIMTPGKVSGTDKTLYMPFYSNDSMLTAKDYEILIVSH